MVVKSVEELHVFQLRREHRLREQLGKSSSAVPALIAEGFPLSADRHFAQSLYRARGESSETRAHLAIAHGRGGMSEDERAQLCDRYNEIERMLTGLIKHLERGDRKRRG